MCSAVAVKPSVPDPFLAALRDEAYLINMLVDLTGQSPEKVLDRFKKEERDMGRNVAEAMSAWELAPHVWTDRMPEFYAQTDAFLFETLVWNRHPVKNQMRRWIANFLRANMERAARILTFGDGLGIDSVYLAMAGHDVDYFEVSPKCASFARSLGASAGQSIRVLGRPDEIDQGAYDVVVCLDVLEHVPDPPALVKQLTGYLKPGGRLIVHAPFWFIDSTVVTHLSSNRKYSGNFARLYRPSDLCVVGGRLFWDPILLEKSVNEKTTTRIRFTKRMELLAGGLLLSVARWWCWPHVFISRRWFRASKSDRLSE